MTEREWNESHPDQCDAYIQAWKQKEQRDNARTAAIQHITAISGGVKIRGRQPRFDDFMVAEKKKESNPKLSEAKLKAALMAWSKQSK